jgi:hypothetical protein
MENQLCLMGCIFLYKLENMILVSFLQSQPNRISKKVIWDHYHLRIIKRCTSKGSWSKDTLLQLGLTNSKQC